MEEIWKDIPEYEGLYQVSNLGRVKSLPKEWVTGFGGVRNHNGKILKAAKNIGGHLNVSLHKDSISKAFFVHQLVAIAFLGHKPNRWELVIDHINDNPSDNRLENLQIVTNRFNSCKTQGKYSSKFKGVCWHKTHKKWQSNIKINGRKKYLGLFDCELKAHQAYQNAMKNLEQTQPF
jgi:hypothetical protein